MTWLPRCMLTAMLVVSMAAAANAQRGNPPAARGNRSGGALSNAELATLLDAYAIVQAQNALQLNDEQYGQFVTRLKRLQDTRRRTTQARSRALQELRRLTKDPGADERALRDQLNALRELDAEGALAIRKEHEAIDELLDAKQQARFRLFEEQLERRKLDLLIRARERATRNERK
jgi:Spy/CpxP family protein refolding chaperone